MKRIKLIVIPVMLYACSAVLSDVRSVAEVMETVGARVTEVNLYVISLRKHSVVNLDRHRFEGTLRSWAQTMSCGFAIQRGWTW